MAAKPPSPPPPEVDAYLAILRANEKIQADFAALFRQHDLSQPTYNVLRILRGARPDGLSCGAIAERMVNRVPDITRLVDRLERHGLVARERSTTDRRVVRVNVTRKGLELLASLEEPVLTLHRLQFAGFSRKELTDLKRLLDRVLAVP